MSKRKETDSEPLPGCSSRPEEKVRIIFSEDEISDDEEWVVLDEIGPDEDEDATPRTEHADNDQDLAPHHDNTNPEIVITIPVADLPPVADDEDQAQALDLHFEGSDVDDGEQALADSSVPRQRPAKYCHVCRKRVTQRLRRHAEEQHVPWWLSPNRACWTCQGTAQSATFTQYNHQDCPQVAMTDDDVPDFIELANGLLRTLQQALDCATPEALLARIVREGWYPQSPRAAKLSLQQKLIMWLWERENRQPLTPFSIMSISPPQAVSNLLHFKVLLLILPHLPQEIQDEIRQGSSVDKGSVRRHRRRITITSDAHCHLNGDTDERDYHGPRDDSALRVTTRIVNFVFPSSWDSFDRVGHNGILGTIGLHPTVCMNKAFLHPRLLSQIDSLVSDRHCVGFGEVGLDYVRGPSPSQQDTQRRHLCTLLRRKPRGMPLVIHCRGGTPAFNDLADILAAEHPKEDAIMLHCFLGSVDDVHRMSQTTKSLYISLSPKSLELPAIHLQGLEAAVRGMELSQLLVETDFPYLSKTPRQDLLRIATWVGRLKGVCACLVLEANRRNVEQLFAMN